MQCTTCEKELNYLVKNFCPYCGSKILTSEKFQNSVEVAGWEEEFLQKNQEGELGTPFFVHDLPMTCTDATHLQMARMAEREREEYADAIDPSNFCHNCGKELSVVAGEAEKKIAQIFTLVVDYGRSIKEGIATGKYSKKDENITDENFLPAKHEQGRKEQTFVFFHYDNAEDHLVIAQMEKDDKRPATLRELFAFCEAHPDFRKNFTIVALGSACVKVERIGRKTKPLTKYGYSKGYDIDLGGSIWRNCLFLAVGK